VEVYSYRHPKGEKPRGIEHHFSKRGRGKSKGFSGQKGVGEEWSHRSQNQHYQNTRREVKKGSGKKM